jgi:L-amino acid N-acyltransferase YncA
MTQAIFSDMREEDLPTLLDIYNHYIATTTATFDPEPVSMAVFRTRVLLNHDVYRAYVIRQMGKTSGFCFLSQFKKHESYDRTAEVGVYLRPEHVRQGLGTRAVGHLEQVAAARGLRMLLASISGENDGSIAFFRRLGWQQCAHFREIGEKWGRRIDVVFFQRLLQGAC